MNKLQLALAYVNSIKNITQGERYTILCFINLLGENPNCEIQGSAAQISKITNTSARTFQRQIDSLEKHEIIKITKHKYDNKMIRANSYSLPGWIAFIDKAELSNIN